MSKADPQHFTEATDTKALSFVVSAVHDVIIQGECLVAAFDFTADSQPTSASAAFCRCAFSSIRYIAVLYCETQASPCPYMHVSHCGSRSCAC